ncbi:MAG: hypothetical protein HYY49_08595, partial [Ignavibacteriales bacterium]|nr:hypothetical protein [Ignavibacteriales bacterium]
MGKPGTITLFLLFVCAAFARSQFVSVPIDHQVYPLLVKGETLGMFDSYSLRVLPLTRHEVVLLLKSMKQHTPILSSADAELVDQMLGEFAELKVGDFAVPENEIHAYRYEEG